METVSARGKENHWRQEVEQEREEEVDIEILHAFIHTITYDSANIQQKDKKLSEALG